MWDLYLIVRSVRARCRIIILKPQARTKRETDSTHKILKDTKNAKQVWFIKYFTKYEMKSLGGLMAPYNHADLKQ